MKSSFDLLDTPLLEGATLIEASAGTGKTYCLSALVLRSLLEGKAQSLGKVLAVTFGKAATQELVVRIRQLLSKAVRAADGEEIEDSGIQRLVERYAAAEHDRLRQALATIDELAVFTIHGFCARVLREAAFESGVTFDFEIVQDQRASLGRAARDFWRATFYPDPLLGAVVASMSWTPECLLELTRSLRRYPEAVVEPERAGLAEARRRLAETVERAAAEFDRGRLENVLRAERLRKDKSKQRLKLSLNCRDARLEAAEKLCTGRELQWFDALRSFTREAVRAGCLKGYEAAADEDPFFASCDDVEIALAVLRKEIVCAFAEDVEARCRQQRRADNLLSYDDLLYRFRDALRDDRRGRMLRESVRDRFDVALVDEFQDTDLCQWEILHRLFGDGRLFLIGDPKQSIYGFRGADVFAYFDAVEHADHRYTLDKNWRSSREMVEAVNVLFSARAHPFLYDEMGFTRVEAGRSGDGPGEVCSSGGPAMHWLWTKRLSNKQKALPIIADAVAARIADLIGAPLAGTNSRVTPADIAVLVRTNEQARFMRDALGSKGISSIVAASGDVFASAEARELQQLLLAIVNPADSGLIRAALATRLCGYDSRAIAALDSEPERAQREADRFAAYLDRWRRRSFMAAMEQAFEEFSTRSRLLGAEEGKRALTNIVHLIELLNGSEDGRSLSPQTALSWFARQRAEAEPDDRSPPEDRALRLDSDAPAVRILTVHKSKGLEYEIVFCPFLLDPIPLKGRPPLLVHEGPERVVADFESAEYARRCAANAAEQTADAVRLAYVALTRARRECYVVAGVIGSQRPCSALSYLLRPANDEEKEMGPGDRATSWATWAESELKEDDRPLLGNLQALVDANSTVMTLEDLLSVRPARPTAAAPADGPRPEARGFPEGARDRLQPWRISSFSSLQRGIDSEEPDHADPPTEVIEERAARGSFALARGARMGRCLHEILERLEFPEVGSEQSEKLVRRTLLHYGLHRPEAHANGVEPTPVVQDMLKHLVEMRLPRQTFSLREIEGSRRLNEWRFQASMGPVSSDELVRAFRRKASEPVREQYLFRLERLGSRGLRGFLTGFVDTLFEYQGHWYVVDWKSNHLGNKLSDYDETAVWNAMCRHDYVLQYHLYVLALHRYLALRMPGYDYRTHFGGVYYVFLRAAQQESAWYYDRPSPDLIEELDRAVKGPA